MRSSRRSRTDGRVNAIVPTEWSARLERRLREASEVLGADEVHDLRVACGRLLVWLDLGGWRVLRDDLRWLRRSAAAVRDLDVVLQRFGGRPWAKELAAQRELAAGDLRTTLKSGRALGLVQSIPALPPPTRDSALAAVQHLERRTERAGDRLRRREEDLERVHALRRAVRRLRYALEWTDDSPSELVRLQNELGQINDLAITDRVLADRAGEEGVQADRDVVASELRARCENLRDVWDEVRQSVEVR